MGASFAVGVAAPAHHELTQTDADAWLDGYMPYALAQANIAGAVVVIVKDGEVLTQRGYGYADVAARRRVDPAVTMFRPGSISKLFTWTAVMQLVEQGKIDLDVDINRYLDFNIPPFRGQHITMRNVMTHRSGFEEAFKGGVTFSGAVPPLGDAVKRLLPPRVYMPGTTPAYSNYAAATAGYIVERVSGMPFDDYVERNIFQPLGMTHTTFRQPLPPLLAPYMAQGYPDASVDAKPFELISVPPAGSLSASAADMAKFMIAHLNHGAGLMKPETSLLMQTFYEGAVPGTNRMALGFYEQRMNGLSAIAHGGDLNYFHSDLWLLPGKNVGLFVSMNSAGTGGENFAIRLALFEQFGDRYYPTANDDPPKELASAKEHAKLLAGSYLNSRGEFSNFIDILNLFGQVKIGLGKDGRPQIPPIFGGAARQWIEIAPFVWQDAYGHQRIGAKMEDGKVARWSMDVVSPFMVWDRTPWYRDAAWLMPVLLLAFVVVALTALSWPAGAISRRRYHATLALQDGDRSAYRWVRVFCWLFLATTAGWSVLFVSISGTEVLDWLIRPLQVAGTIVSLGLVGSALWNLQLVFKGRRGWFARTWSVLLSIAALCIVGGMLDFHLLTFGNRY